jgi:hypothetical protein
MNLERKQKVLKRFEENGFSLENLRRITKQLLRIGANVIIPFLFVTYEGAK